MQNSNNQRSIAFGSHAVDFSAQIQDKLDTLCIPTGHSVMEEALFICILFAYMLSPHRLPETTKVFFVEQRQNVVLVMPVIYEMK